MNQLLDLYSDYLIAQNQYATAIGLSDLLEGRISHDKITRFLNGNEFSSKELGEYIRPLPKLRVRRFMGLFCPIFDFFCRGHIRVDITPAKRIENRTKEPVKRQNFSFGRGLF